jgi:outer membrane protein OmpU
MKKTLLSSSAIAGAALLAVPVATPAFAGTAEVGDSFTVTISGGYRFSILAFDQDIRPVGNGQGYRFASDEAEVKFAAGGVADNGLEYGFEMELNTQTDDGANADETWAYLRGNWGEINLGDQDDAADRMAIGGEDAMPGRGGYDGAIGDVFNFSGENNFTGNGATFTGDSTKVTYFTPRFFGFQLGASFTPDSGHDGGEAPSDADTGEMEVGSLGLNYAEDFNGFGVIVAGTLVYSDNVEIAGIEVDERYQYQAGLLLSYAGFQIGAAYGGDERPSAVGSTEEAWWADVGLNYSTGPWKIGGGYFYSETDDDVAGGDDPNVSIISVGANYQVAPGMAIASDVNYVEEDNAVAPDNEGTVFVFSTIFSF